MLNPGIQGNKAFIVGPAMLATTYSSGTQEVLATPALIALMEQTAMESVQPLLDEGFSTVGTHVNVFHEEASLPGETIIIRTLLVAAEGRKLTFEVSASGETGRIGYGTHERYIIHSERFMKKLNERKAL